MWSFTLTLYRTGPVCSMAVLVRDKRLQGAVGWAGTISCWPTLLYPAYSDPTLSWHFNPEGAVLGWRRWFFVEDRIKLVLQSSSSLLSCYSFLRTLHQFFRITIGCMGGRCTHNMLNTISSCKFPKCFWRELWSVIRSHMLRESQVGKQGAQCANTLLSSSVLHHKDRRPLAVCLKSPPLASFLDLDQWSLCKAFAREGREISTGGEMNWLDYLICCLLTSLTIIWDRPLFILVEDWLPNIAPGQAFLLDHTYVSLVECFQTLYGLLKGKQRFPFHCWS